MPSQPVRGSKPTLQHFPFIWTLKLCLTNASAASLKILQKRKLGTALLLLSFSKRGPGSDLWAPSYKEKRGKKEIISLPPMCQRKQARQRGCAYAARARLGQGLTSGCLSSTKETVALTQPDCSPSKGMDWEEVTLTALLLQGTLWITVALLFLPSSGKSEKLTLRTLSYFVVGARKNKTFFSWNGWARTVEVLTFCCFCLGKHWMIPRLIHMFTDDRLAGSSSGSERLSGFVFQGDPKNNLCSSVPKN